jgi:hypothetical protein
LKAISGSSGERDEAILLGAWIRSRSEKFDGRGVWVNILEVVESKVRARNLITKVVVVSCL